MQKFHSRKPSALEGEVRKVGRSMFLGFTSQSSYWIWILRLPENTIHRPKSASYHARRQTRQRWWCRHPRHGKFHSSLVAMTAFVVATDQNRALRKLYLLDLTYSHRGYLRYGVLLVAREPIYEENKNHLWFGL